jgi:hypothetical protein
MDVVWDQDVRTALAAIIGREPTQSEEDSVKQVTRHIQLAIRYANELSKARGELERRGGGRTEVSYARVGQRR